MLTKTSSHQIPNGTYVRVPFKFTADIGPGCDISVVDVPDGADL
jgi:hypothetical protein